MSFTLLEERKIEELDSTARLYIHDATGARLLSIANADENKSFGVSFRTPPSRSDGIAHILEHSVLCGSDKYPVKEPFVELVKGSLNTFLNAFTYPDKTVYPVASTNLKDFYNLVDVYLDAVFHPLLTEDTFRQEGWHYEVGAEGALEYKGVVFNEMKGAYSDPDDQHDDLCRRSLFPDTAYGLDSGGDPSEIPGLDYRTFSEFHRKYYHPSNSFIFFYGDDDPAERLAIIERWLDGYSRDTVDSLPGIQVPFDAPRQIRAAFEGNEPKAWVAVNWALSLHGDPETSLALAILSHILIGTASSPLRVALIESGLGEDLAGFGLEDALRQGAWSVGLKGVSPERSAEVEALVLSTLEKLAREGIDEKTVAASMNTVEFALREKNTGRFPRGLAVMLEALGEWLYDGDPIGALAFETSLSGVRKGLEGGRYFESLVERWLINNPHRTTVTLAPDPDAGKDREEREKASLAAARTGMSGETLEETAAIARRLKVLQETPDSPEALARIPALELDDLPAETSRIPSEAHHCAGSTILYHELPTSSILYLDCAFTLDQLEDELVPYTGLLGRLFLEMGTGTMDYIALGQEIGTHTGGINASTFATTRWDNHEVASYFLIRSKALASNTETLLGLLRTVLLEANLDNRERFRQIVLEEKAQTEASVIPSGHRLVGLRLRSRLSKADAIAEKIGGLEHLFFLRNLAERMDSDWPGVLAELEKTRRAIVNADDSFFNVTIDKSEFVQLRPRLERFIESLPRTARRGKFERSARPAQGLEMLAAPSQVNFVGTAMAIPTGNLRTGAFLVAKKYLDTTFLWEKVRVQGGAYGGFSNFDINSGVFMFLSYRDPNIEKTLDTFAGAGKFLSELSVSREEIVRSIIGTIGDIDAYQLPDAKGFTSLIHHLTGYSHEARQGMRNQVLSADVPDFSTLGRVLEEAMEHASSAVLSSRQKAEDLPAALKGDSGILQVL